jgi:signal transduction histidine kinase
MRGPRAVAKSPTRSSLSRQRRATPKGADEVPGEPEAVRSDFSALNSRRHLSELAQHLQLSVENERAAIAREIHDDVAGALTAAKFDLAWIARHSDAMPVQQRLASALEAIDQAIEATQRIAHNLRPAILEQGLVAALQWLTSQFERRSGVQCRFRTSHETLQLPPAVPLVAYRFAQEALTNVSKHAKAKHTLVDLSLAREVLSLEVSDDGQGLSMADVAKSDSFGIRGLRERAGTVGGWVDVTSGRDGTTLMLSIPIGRDVPAPRASRGEPWHDPSSWDGGP